MTAAARDVAAVLRARQPGLPTKKLHKLLYYCQGHHLAALDEPLFVEGVAAWDMGPVVGALWSEEKRGELKETHDELGEAELNTIGYVLSRYGALSGTDLEHLTHGETPWKLADAQRGPRGSTRIEREWMRDYFRGPGAPGADEDGVAIFDSTVVADLLAGADARRGGEVAPDDLDDIRRLAIGG